MRLSKIPSLSVSFQPAAFNHRLAENLEKMKLVLIVDCNKVLMDELDLQQFVPVLALHFE